MVAAIEFPAAYGSRPNPVSIHDQVDDRIVGEMFTRLALASSHQGVDPIALADKLVRLAREAGALTNPLPTGPKSQVRALAAIDLFWPGWIRRELLAPAIDAARANSPSTPQEESK